MQSKEGLVITRIIETLEKIYRPMYMNYTVLNYTEGYPQVGLGLYVDQTTGFSV